MDPATLLWAADMIVQRDLDGLNRRAGHIGGYGGRVAGWLKEAADEAASQPPMLSGWIMACEGTGLGEPRFRVVHGATEDWWEVFFPGFDREVASWTMAAVAWESAYVITGDEAGNVVEVSTPAELRAALDRLADERARADALERT